MRPAVTSFSITFAAFRLLNGLSYFVLSDGYGVLKVYDGVVRIGFPFVIFERGGIAYQEYFHADSLGPNMLCSLMLAGSVSFFHSLTRRGGEEDERNTNVRD